MLIARGGSKGAGWQSCQELWAVEDEARIGGEENVVAAAGGGDVDKFIQHGNRQFVLKATDEPDAARRERVQAQAHCRAAEGRPERIMEPPRRNARLQGVSPVKLQIGHFTSSMRHKDLTKLLAFRNSHEQTLRPILRATQHRSLLVQFRVSRLDGSTIDGLLVRSTTRSFFVFPQCFSHAQAHHPKRAMHHELRNACYGCYNAALLELNHWSDESSHVGCNLRVARSQRRDQVSVTVSLHNRNSQHGSNKQSHPYLANICVT